MIKTGLTGGMGVGKSSAAKAFHKLGVHIFDADKEAKKLLDNSVIIQNDLMAEFGTDILGKSGKIDRTKLAKISFQDEYHQSNLNSIIHPHIFEKIDEKFEKVTSKKKASFFMVDGALIYESGLDTHLDYIIVITAKLSIRMERSIKKGNLSREDIMRRMDLQWPCETKARMADFLIHNNTNTKDLNRQVKDIYDKLV
jgi:dephospho-CoA kinase